MHRPLVFQGHRARRTGAALIAACALLGCAGGGSMGSSPFATGTAGAQATEGGTGGASGSDSATDGGSGDADAERLPMRRLTRSQYSNVVADLLGDTTQPGSSLSADATAYGYESNGEGELIALLGAEEYETVADAVATRAAANLLASIGCSVDGVGEATCVDAFLTEFVPRAYRRPLNTEERTRLEEFYDGQRLDHDPPEAMRLLLKTVLMSPRFLYRLEPRDPDDWTIASRLSFLLWNTIPDAALAAAAAEGLLTDPAEVEAQARRMLEDPRAEATILDFHRQWLQLDWVYTAAKDAAVFPEYTPVVQDLLVAETQAFIADAIFQGDGTLQTLLAAPHTFLSPELAGYYGHPAPAGPPGVMTKTSLDPDRAAGLLTQGAFLAAHATATTTSPVRRGKFVRERLLCGHVPTPPAGIDVTPPDPAPGTTTRQRYAEHSEDPVCATCHKLMDPIGLGFEHYDAIGRWRDTEDGLTIDPTVELVEVDAETDGTFSGLTELAQRLAVSPSTRDCVARQWFRFAYGRDDRDEAYADSMDSLLEAFDDADGDIRELVVGLTQTELFLGESQ